MTDSTSQQDTVYDAALLSAHLYTSGFNPNLEYRPFVDRFELHLQNWDRGR